MDKKYGVNYNLLFSNGIKWRVFVSCDIKISAMVTTCSVKNTRISSSLKTICINKPPLQTDGLDGINNPIYSINATEQTSLYSLTDRAYEVPCVSKVFSSSPRHDALDASSRCVLKHTARCGIPYVSKVVIRRFVTRLRALRGRRFETNGDSSNQ